jgi:hypothetical protein
MKISDLFPSKYVKAADLNGKPFTLAIKKLVIEEMGHGTEKEKKPVLYFSNAAKGLVLNRTNAMIIANLYGDESDGWVGKRVTIYPTQVRAFGQMQDCIRVREEIPAQPKPQQQTQQVEESAIDDMEDVVDHADEDIPFHDPSMFEPTGYAPA